MLANFGIYIYTVYISYIPLLKGVKQLGVSEVFQIDKGAPEH